LSVTVCSEKGSPPTRRRRTPAGPRARVRSGVFRRRSLLATPSGRLRRSPSAREVICTSS
jgi:hypothetical protein